MNKIYFVHCFLFKVSHIPVIAGRRKGLKKQLGGVRRRNERLVVLKSREHPMLNFDPRQLVNPHTLVGIALAAYAVLLLAQVAQ